MADENKVTTVQIDKEVSRRLSLLARINRRSKSGQVEYMVDAEYRKLENVKLLPEEEEGKEVQV